MTPEHPDNLRIVLVSPRNPLNIGAAARAMSNFGFRHLRVVNPYEVAFREARSAVKAGAILESAAEYRTVAEAVADCTLVVGTTAAGKRELHHPLRRLEYAGKLLRKALAAGPVALLFGSEKFGLGNEDLAYCHWLLRIPAREEHGSMNLGQSVAVCLYELIRVSRVPTPGPRKRPTSEDLERMTELLLEVLQRSGYVHASSTEAKVRRLVRRLDLSAHDAEIWIGMMRQILWKIGYSDQVTKVDIHYDLVRPLTDADASAVANVHSWYGIGRVRVAPAGEAVDVEYDASRLTEKDVEDALLRFGIPIRRKGSI